jgi:diguanylate cyclase (GGDEF)-like protein/PAS domain S-box-containing protein
LRDTRVALKGGGYRWVSGVSQEIRDHDGTYRGRVLTLTDVHDRVLAEQRLAANEQQFRHVLENVGDVILRYAPDLTLEWASPSLETVFGWSPNDVVGTSFTMTRREDGYSAQSALDSAIAAGDTQYKNQVRVACADGSLRWVDSTFRLVRDGNGEHESTIIVLRDSTAQVETEELLHSARNHYRMLVENSTDFVIQCDPSGIVEWVSDSVTRTLGWEVEDLIGSNGFDLVHPEDLAELRDTLDLPHDQMAGAWRLRFRNSSGDFHWISYTVGQLFDADGNLTKRIGGFQIIDSQVAVEAALEASEEHYRLMAENSSDFVIKTSPEAVIEWVSDSVTRTLGWAPHDMIARSRFAFIAPEDRAFARQQSADLGQGEQVACRLRMICADGTVRQLGYSAKPVVNDSNELVAHVGGYRDIEQEVAAEQARLRIEQRLTLTMQSSPVGLALTDLDRKFVEVNPAFCALLNTDSEWLLGRAISEILPSEVDEVDRLHRETILSGEQESVRMETRIIRPDGSSAWVSRSLALLRTADGAPEAYICQFVDLSEQHAIQVALAHSEQRFRRAMDSATAGLAVVGLNRTFVEVNPALHHMLGLEPEWFLDHSIEDILNVGDNVVDLRMRSELRKSPEDHTTRQMRLTHADGTDIWVDHSISTLRDQDGDVISFLSQFVDITETVSKRDELQFQASHDTLTLLANRRALFERTAKILAHPARTGEQIGVMYCDLDNLKAINDIYGHTAGDQVLVAIANRLVALVRSDDTVARVGGDEFVIALAAVHSIADLEHLAQKLRGAAAEPVQTDGGSVQPGISIGMALAHRGDQFEAVLQNADLALHQAKLRGGNCAVAYDTSFGRDCPPEVAGDGCRPQPNNA